MQRELIQGNFIMIKTTVKFTDHTKEFKSRVAAMADMMMGTMAAGIEIQIKTSGKTPFKHGALRASARHQKAAVGKYEVSMDKEYAAAQEVGTTRGYRIQNYTTPGTGPGFFQAAVDTVKSRANQYARTAMAATGLGGE